MLKFKEIQNGVSLLKNGEFVYELTVGSKPVCVGFGNNFEDVLTQTSVLTNSNQLGTTPLQNKKE